MNIFTLKDANEMVSDNINLDDLYEKKRESDEMKHQLYNRILNRIHERIKITSRQKKDEQYCWYIIPEIMVGIPKYDSHECTSYILDKLNVNGFQVNYTHPNLVFISWQHHVPSYVRSEFKKKTGIAIDSAGNRTEGGAGLRANGMGANVGLSANAGAGFSNSASAGLSANASAGLSANGMGANKMGANGMGANDGDINNLIFNTNRTNDPTLVSNQKKTFKSIDNYKPSGNFIYNADLFEKLGEKLNK